MTIGWYYRSIEPTVVFILIHVCDRAGLEITATAVIAPAQHITLLLTHASQDWKNFLEIISITSRPPLNSGFGSRNLRTEAHCATVPISHLTSLQVASTYLPHLLLLALGVLVAQLIGEAWTYRDSLKVPILH